MNTKFVAIILSFSLLSSAQDLSEARSGQTYVQTQMQEGRLINVTLTLGNPLRIFVTGKEEAQLNLSKLKLRVRRLDPYKGEELIFDKEGRYYTVKMPEADKRIEALEVITTIDNQTEAFHFKLHNEKP